MTKYTMIFILFIFISCTKSDNSNNNIKKTIEDLIIKNNEISGWTFSGSGWIANNISELTTYIDGAAEIYQKYGFVEAVSQTYSGKVNNQSADLRVSIYNHGTKVNASAVYIDPDVGLIGANELTNIGNAGHYIRNGGLSQVLSFFRDKYYIILDINSDSDESLGILKQFALNIDAKVK